MNLSSNYVISHGLNRMKQILCEKLRVGIKSYRFSNYHWGPHVRFIYLLQNNHQRVLLNEETPIFCILTPNLKFWSIFNPNLMEIWEISKKTTIWVGIWYFVTFSIIIMMMMMMPGTKFNKLNCPISKYTFCRNVLFT